MTTPEEGLLVTEINAIHLFCDGGLQSMDMEIKAMCFERSRKAYRWVRRFHRRISLSPSRRFEVNMQIEGARRKLVMLGEELPADKVRWDTAARR
jgi:hypothetical protein